MHENKKVLWQCDVKSSNKVSVFLLKFLICRGLVLNVTLCLNLNYGCFGVWNLIQEGISYNTGSLVLRTAIRDTHYQSHPRYGESAECSLNVRLTFILLFQSLRTQVKCRRFTWTIFLSKGLKHLRMVVLMSH